MSKILALAGLFALALLAVPPVRPAVVLAFTVRSLVPDPAALWFGNRALARLLS